MIKTKLVGLDVMVNDIELKVGDKVLMKTVTGAGGHNKIFEILDVKKGIQGIRNSYYVVKTDNETEFEIEATWFDNPTRKTYLIEE